MRHDAQVFISYQRSDVDAARAVREALVAHGIRAWMDQFDIVVGAYWPDAIDEGLASSDIVVGFLSPGAVASRNVKNEWDWALANDKPLLLLRVKPCVIPHRYVSINFIDAVSGLESALPDLFGALNQLLVNQDTIPETLYALSGHLNIAYQVYGDGPIDLVVTPGSVSNLDWIWDSPIMSRHFRRYAEFARVITFDKRGTGLSDRDAGIPSLAERIDDLRAVMDAAGSTRAVIMGVSQGGSMAVQFAADYPERTSALILYGTMVRHNSALASAEENCATEEQILGSWGRDVHEMVAMVTPSMVGDSSFVEWFARYARAAASPGAVVALRRADALIDIGPLLGRLTMPTLVLHRVGDRDVPIEQGRYLAAHIPGARLVELPGNDHWPFVGDQESIFDAIETFFEADVHHPDN